MIDNLNQKVKSLPLSSGVYLMKNINGEIIYVGKAKNLKNRVSQYFQNTKKPIKVQLMVDNIHDFEYIITPSELDAFILENTLIKKYKPFFNVLLKDGKQYPYIRVNQKDLYPRFSVVRKVKKDGAKYFGPYYGKINAYELLKTINSAYSVRTCNKEFKVKKRTRPCLNYSLGLCSGPCCDKISQEDYKIIVNKAIHFLNGDEKEIKEILKNKMELASESENFELAITLRNRLAMINELSNKTIVDLAKNAEMDIFSVIETERHRAINCTIVRTGKILFSKNFDISNSGESLSESVSSFLLQYYNEKLIPKLILFNIDFDFNLIKEALAVSCEHEIEFAVPIRGVKKKLVDMATKNVTNFLQKEIISKDDTINFEMANALQKALQLPKPLTRLECYDISHISGTNKVGSMVVFEFGKPNKNDYRKFKIKTIEGNDDFACLQEILSRRVKDYDSKLDLSFSKKPDLLIIDGGKGQLSSVCEQLVGTSFENVPIISLAKKNEEVFIPQNSNPLVFEKGSLELRLLQNIRDEAHRFAITFHRELRNKNAFN